MYQIEKGIALPTKRTPKSAKTVDNKPPQGVIKLIATHMEVGDSVLFPTHNQAKNLSNQLWKQDKKATTRCIQFDKRYRVWRTS